MLYVIFRFILWVGFTNANAVFDKIQVAKEGGVRWKSMTDEVSVGLTHCYNHLCTHLIAIEWFVIVLF